LIKLGRDHSPQPKDQSNTTYQKVFLQERVELVSYFVEDLLA